MTLLRPRSPAARVIRTEYFFCGPRQVVEQHCWRARQALVWALDLLDGEYLRGLPRERRKGELKILLKRASFGKVHIGVVRGGVRSIRGATTPTAR